MINIKDLSIILIRFVTYLYKHIKFNKTTIYDRQLFHIKALRAFQTYDSISFRKQT